MTVRYAKICLVAALALFMSLVVFNNVFDYGSNFAFVQHVLSMDDTFPGNAGRWRAFTWPVVHHASYVVIIAWELAAAVLCWRGAARLWRKRANPAPDFHAAKPLAIAGLTVGLLLWLVAFITIGGEWFLMWQSRVWNGQEAAFRMFAGTALVLLFVDRRES